jgi:hypothetical protein
LTKKLSVCSTVTDSFDPSDPHNRQKDIALRELLDLFDNDDVYALDSASKSGIFDMLLKNILRIDPVFPSPLDTYIYTLEVVERTWRTLSTCYNLLHEFMDRFPDLPSINATLREYLFFLTQQPDSRERDSISRLLVRYYNIRPKDQQAFINSLKIHLIFVQENSYIPLAAPPLLMCALHLITPELMPHRSELIDLLRFGILPLLASQYLVLFGHNLALVLTNGYLREAPELSWMILEGVQSRWPKTCGIKQVCFTDLLLSIILRIPQTDFLSMEKHLFPFLADLARSPNAIVVTIVLSIFDRPAWVRLLKLVGFQAVEPLYNALHSQQHWLETIRAKSQNLIDMIATEYPWEVQDRDDRNVSNKNVTVDGSMAGWAVIIEAGGSDFDGMALRKKLNEMIASDAPLTWFMRTGQNTRHHGAQTSRKPAGNSVHFTPTTSARPFF